MAEESPSKLPKKKKTRIKSSQQKGSIAAPGNQQTQGTINFQSTSPAFHQSHINSAVYNHNENFHQMQPMPAYMQHLQSSMHPSTSQVIPQWSQDICTCLDIISKRLEKLDVKETSLTSMQSEIKNLNLKVLEVEESQEFISKSFKENEVNATKALDHLDEITELKHVLENTMTENKRLNEEIIDIQCRSMRDNLIFYGIKEDVSRRVENCEEIISDVCRNVLNIQESIEIEHAHRMGRKMNDKPRPVVVKLSRFPQREMVRKSIQVQGHQLLSQ